MTTKEFLFIYNMIATIWTYEMNKDNDKPFGVNTSVNRYERNYKAKADEYYHSRIIQNFIDNKIEPDTKFSFIGYQDCLHTEEKILYVNIIIYDFNRNDENIYVYPEINESSRSFDDEPINIDIFLDRKIFYYDINMTQIEDSINIIIEWFIKLFRSINNSISDMIVYLFACLFVGGSLNKSSQYITDKLLNIYYKRYNYNNKYINRNEVSDYIQIFTNNLWTNTPMIMQPNENFKIQELIFSIDKILSYNRDIYNAQNGSNWKKQIISIKSDQE